jgi:hypothetical protein
MRYGESHAPCAKRRSEIRLVGRLKMADPADEVIDDGGDDELRKDEMDGEVRPASLSLNARTASCSLLLDQRDLRLRII